MDGSVERGSGDGPAAQEPSRLPVMGADGASRLLRMDALCPGVGLVTVVYFNGRVTLYRVRVGQTATILLESRSGEAAHSSASDVDHDGTKGLR